jgi:hypothetical protein
VDHSNGDSAFPAGYDEEPEVWGNTLDGLNIQVTQPEHREQRQARLRQSETDARLRRWKDAVLFVVALLVMMLLMGVCLWALLNPHTSSEMKDWATHVIMLIIGGFVGFLTGKKTAG